MKTSMTEVQKGFHALTVEEALKILGTDPERGLTSEEAIARLKKYGPNRVEPVTRISALKIFAKQFANILMGLLLLAVLVSAFLGEVVDAVVIGVIVFFVAVVGFVQEYRAERTLEALKKMLTPFTTVVRDGVEKSVKVDEVVPGDIVVLGTGSKVPADLRLIETVNLMVDEAPLTGESTPVSKTIDPLPLNTSLADRINLVYAGTNVTYGRGKGVVYATGEGTEFGKIARTAAGLEEEKTPLEVRMNEIGRKFAFLAAAIIAMIVVVELVTEMLSGVFSFGFVVEVLLFSVALAVAVVPEALPGVVTATLAIGMGIMARRNALVRKMPAVETLGSTQVICFDKTGTLTLNQMRVRQLYIDNEHVSVESLRKGSPSLELAIKACVLCNDAVVVAEKGRREVRGDPTEGALLMFAEDLGYDVNIIRNTNPRVDEIPFTSERKMMTTVNKSSDGKLTAYMKGAVEAVLQHCTKYIQNGEIRQLTVDDRNKIIRAGDDMASKGLRSLALAYRELNRLQKEDLEQDFTFIGIVGMMDALRPDAVEAVKKAHMAGIKTVMVTGDHKLTALTIAKEAGIYREGDLILTGEDLDRMTDEELEQVVEKVVVYARISPMHKLRIVEAWKKKGYVVAMTGDGVNDAPAIKRADIGIAMGITGTDVSKEASDIILGDDNFATIVKAVELGRWVYGNVKKYLVYLLEANLVEVLVIGLGAIVISRVLGLAGEEALPLLPIHILYINLATDGLPAIALGFSPPDPDIMKRKPRRRDEPVFDKEVLRFLILILLTATPIYMAGYITGLAEGVEYARSRLFMMFFANELALAISCRSLRYPVYKVSPHKWLILAILWETVLLATILSIPGGAEILKIKPLNMVDWAWVLGGALFLFIILEITKALTSARDE